MLTTVARFSTVGEAESARSALDAAGIDVDVADENVVGLEWLWSNAVGGVKLRVREDDSEKATFVLANIAAEASEADAITEPVEREAAPPLAPALCPACGSADVTRIPRLMIFAALAAAAFSVGIAVEQPQLALAGVVAVGIIVSMTPSRRCNACGERWSAAELVDREVHAPPPNPSDTIEPHCPRCGSMEFYPIEYRRLKALSMIFSLAWIFIVPVWLLLPKRQCDACGKRTWMS